MPCVRRPQFTVMAIVVVVATVGVALGAQHTSYRLADDAWGQLPASMNGGKWGELGAAYPDRQGNLWVFHKCFSGDCLDRTDPPMLKFDPSGKLLTAWGQGMFVWPHNVYVDRDGNIWAVDAGILEPYTRTVRTTGTAKREEPAKGNQVFKFSPAGQLLLTLGTKGVVGDGPSTFNGPTAVVVAQNGDIFVSDGHGNNRVVKFSKDGTFIKAWGKKGTGPGEFDVPHGVAMDSRGRLFVADQGNNRIQVFDQEGTFLDQWKQFGRASGIFIAPDDTLYAADHQSTPERNPGYRMGIYMGSVRDGKVTGVIEDTLPPPGSGAEQVVADAQGNLFVAVVSHHTLRKYVKQ